jgi:hypothetical protein
MSSLQTVVDGASSALSSIAGNNTVASFFTGIASTSLNELAQAIKAFSTQVVLNGIPILTESVKLVHSVDIPSTMVIDETTRNKNFVTDNTAPRPRVWTVSGYLTSLAPTIESYMIIKPTLLLQRKILELAINSRDKVKIKLNTGEIIDVYIQQLSIEDNAKAMNASIINVTVSEAVTLNTCVLSSLADLTKSQTMSLPSSNTLNLGVRNVTSTVITNILSL